MSTLPPAQNPIVGFDTSGNEHWVQIDSSGDLHVTVDNFVSPTMPVTVVQSSGSNLHVDVDSIPTTTVQQSTGSNLHVVADAGSTTAVTQATGTNLHTVVDSGSIVATQTTGTNLHTIVDNQTQDSAKNVLTAFGGSAVDAFNRARVASPTALFEGSFQYDTQPLIYTTSITGTGSIAKTTNESSLTLSTGGTASGAQAINQTKQYFRYQPGRSTQVLMTGLLGAQKTNVQSAIGYFDANDGIFFQMDGTAGPSVNQRSSTSGSAVTTSVTQSNWNIDHMDGTGPSGITINFANTQIFIIDLQWLGVGRVRLGFVVNGLIYYCHQFQNANIITSPYMNTANLPCRAMITNTGVAASATTMKQICMSVMSEGGVQYPQAYQFSVSNGVTTITAASGTRTPLLSIQPALTFGGITNRVYVPIEQLEVYASGANASYWELVYNGTLTGASFGAVNTNSSVNYDISASACTGGIIVDAGYVGSSGGPSRSTIQATITALFPFALDINGANPATFTLCAAGIGGTAPSAAQFGWSEIR